MPRTPTTPRLTAHASRRSRQRSVRDEVLDLVHLFGDIDLPAGRGCTRRMLSQRTSVELLAEGYPTAIIGRAARATLVVGGDGAIITAWTRRADARRASLRRRRVRSGHR